MVSDQAVEPGSTVVIRVGEREESWTVVAPHEADYLRRRVSEMSPLGFALLGRRPGETVVVRSPQPYTASSSPLTDGRSEPDERDVLKTLVLLAGESRVYRLHLENARPVIERLVADIDDVDAALLLTSVTAALAEAPRLGTPRHLERLALAVQRELKE